MSSPPHHVIIGNGPAGTSALEYLRSRNKKSRITVISDEGLPFYVREHLCKVIEKDKDESALFEKGLDIHDVLDVEFIGEKVKGVISRENSLILESGTMVSYDSLLIASGGKPRELRVPGMGLDGISTFYSIHDLRKIRKWWESAKDVAIIGAGTIALKLIPVVEATKKKLTLIERSDSILERYLDPSIASIFKEEMRNKGITIFEGVEVEEFEGSRGKLEGIMLSNGTRVACDIAIITIGVLPSIDFLKDSGIHVDRGVVVDLELRTNVSNVFAAGDVAQVPDPIHGGKAMLHPSWSIAREQGLLAAKSMLGEKVNYKGPILATKLRLGDIGCISAMSRDLEDVVVKKYAPVDGKSILQEIVQCRDGKIIGGAVVGRHLDLKKLKKKIITTIRDFKTRCGDFLEIWT